ncbi:hypothetical protein [Neisseria musculi]|uniref:hypothetical protein n=1 Tax=Neisseria musculi TaxID=1815583 RepID=UPI00164BE847|nr:hypothetical protein [Neisseria musculi]
MEDSLSKWTGKERFYKRKILQMHIIMTVYSGGGFVRVRVQGGIYTKPTKQEGRVHGAGRQKMPPAAQRGGAGRYLHM